MMIPRSFRAAGQLAAFLFVPCTLLAAPSWLATGEIPSSVTAGLVRIEAFVQADDGEDPSAAGWRTRCPNCGNYHVSDVDDALRERRPVTTAGFLVSPEHVILADPVIQPRFVRKWHVRFGDEVIPARVSALATDRAAVRLTLDRPFRSARPLEFTAAAKGPYSILNCNDGEDGPSIQLEPLGSNWVNKSDGRRFLPVPTTAIILAADGRPVALTLREELPTGDAWKTAPANWPWKRIEDFTTQLETARSAADAFILRAGLRFRSPRPVPGEDLDGRRGDLPDSALAMTLGARRALVLAGLLPRQTARLETIVLYLADGRQVTACFVATVAELGAIIVETSEPLPAVPDISPESWADQRGRIVYSLHVAVNGNQRTVRGGHLRLASIGPGFNGREVPRFAAGARDLFVFDDSGRLLGLPVSPRPAASANRWESDSARFLLHASELAAFGGDPTAFADVRNIPQSEEEENRLAWLGVEAQPLDRELAQVHGVAAQVQDGSGALVTHVFPGSPAERAGLAAGDVLLRIQAAGSTRPIPIEISAGRFAFDVFPWDRYDELPEPYYDQVPSPWLSAENEITTLLKDFGFGASYRLDFARSGKVQTVEMVVEAGPAHYATAPQSEDAGLGLTVRNLTFETRLYFQIPEGEPGVLVSRVIAGSRASTGGVKPYEIITTVNHRPVRTAAEFAESAAQAGALTFSVRRMQHSRIVTLAPAP